MGEKPEIFKSDRNTKVSAIWNIKFGHSIVDSINYEDNAYFVATKSRHQIVRTLADQSHIKPRNGDFYRAFMFNETEFPRIKNTRRKVTNAEFKAFEEFYANDHNGYPKSSEKKE